MLSYSGSGSEQAPVFDLMWLECGRCNRRGSDGASSLESGAELVMAAKWRLRLLSWVQAAVVAGIAMRAGITWLCKGNSRGDGGSGYGVELGVWYLMLSAANYR